MLFLDVGTVYTRILLGEFLTVSYIKPQVIQQKACLKNFSDFIMICTVKWLRNKKTTKTRRLNHMYYYYYYYYYYYLFF
jgi:hypothetical protein